MEASITLDCSNYSENIIDIIKIFQRIGWNTHNSQGEVTYLPIGDNDMYNWVKQKLSKDELYTIISHKIIANEQIGIDLFYNNGNEGLSLLAYNTSQILLSLSINRKRIDTRHTDMVWYWDNIIHRFMNEGIELLSYTLKEYDD